MADYDNFNREERAICAHLFRLLHERLQDNEQSPLCQFLNILSNSNLIFKNGNSALTNLAWKNVAIYCEVSIIRDAFYSKKPNVNEFMDDLTRLIMKQEGVNECCLYSVLPGSLNNIKKTHPKQIRQKALTEGVQLSADELNVYGAMQGMFNAKPDLVITIDNVMLVCEAKHTEKFDDDQLERTWNIAEVWSKLLYKELGFSEPPVYSVFKLGESTYKPHISWTDIAGIADRTYGENDRTRIAINAGVDLLKKLGLE